MVFLTSLDILDTGFLTVSSTSRVSSANMVNSGNALRLKSIDMNITSSAALDKNVTPGNHDIIRDDGAEEHPLITINPTEFTLSIFLNTKNTSTSNEWGINDMAILPYLLRLPQTRGLKAIYYPVAGNFRQRSSQMVYQLGASDVFAAQDDIDITLAASESTSSSGYDLTDVNYLVCRFESCAITQAANNAIKVTLSGVISR